MEEKIIGPINYSINIKPSLDESGEFISIKVMGAKNLVSIFEPYACRNEGFIKTPWRNYIIERYRVKSVLINSYGWDSDSFALFFTKEFLDTGIVTIKVNSIQDFNDFIMSIKRVKGLIDSILNLNNINGCNIQLVIKETKNDTA